MALDVTTTWGEISQLLTQPIAVIVLLILLLREFGLLKGKKNGKGNEESLQLVKDIFGSFNDRQQKTLDKVIDLFQENSGVIEGAGKNQKELADKIDAICSEIRALKMSVQELCGRAERLLREVDSGR